MQQEEAWVASLQGLLEAGAAAGATALCFPPLEGRSSTSSRVQEVAVQALACPPTPTEAAPTTLRAPERLRTLQQQQQAQATASST